MSAYLVLWAKGFLLGVPSYVSVAVIVRSFRFLRGNISEQMRNDD